MASCRSSLSSSPSTYIVKASPGSHNLLCMEVSHQSLTEYHYDSQGNLMAKKTSSQTVRIVDHGSDGQSGMSSTKSLTPNPTSKGLLRPDARTARSSVSNDLTPVRSGGCGSNSTSRKNYSSGLTPVPYVGSGIKSTSWSSFSNGLAPVRSSCYGSNSTARKNLSSILSPEPCTSTRISGGSTKSSPSLYYWRD